MSDVSLAVAVGLVCALLSALGTNLAFLFKHKGAVAGWGVAAVAFALHVAALSLAPLSIGQAILAGGLVFLAVLAERFFGFELGRRQWIGIGLVAVSLHVADIDRRRRSARRLLARGDDHLRGHQHRQRTHEGQGHHLLRPRHGHTRRACRDARWRTCSRRFRRGRRRRGVSRLS